MRPSTLSNTKSQTVTGEPFRAGSALLASAATAPQPAEKSIPKSPRRGAGILRGAGGRSRLRRKASACANATADKPARTGARCPTPRAKTTHSRPPKLCRMSAQNPPHFVRPLFINSGLRFRRDNQPAPRRCGHHPRLRPRRIPPAARGGQDRGVSRSVISKVGMLPRRMERPLVWRDQNKATAAHGQSAMVLSKCRSCAANSDGLRKFAASR